MRQKATRQEATPAWAHHATAGTVLHPRIHAECPGASACWPGCRFPAALC